MSTQHYEEADARETTEGRVFTVTVDDAETAVRHIRSRLAAVRG